MSHTPQGTGGTCTACTHNDRSVVILCLLHRAAPALVAACEKAKRALETIKATGKIDWKLVDVGYGITELSTAIAAAKGE